MTVLVGSLIAVMVVGGCSKEGKKEKKSSPKKPAAGTRKEVASKMGEKKIVMVIAQNNFRDEELNQPKKILEDKGFDVKVASSSKETATGMLGTRVEPDLTLDEISVDDLDALIFIGGGGAREYWNNNSALSLAKEADDSGKILGAICIAPVILANAGVLTGKKATVFSTERDELESKEVTCTGKEVERDGNIITSSGPEVATEFGNAIVEALQ